MSLIPTNRRKSAVLLLVGMGFAAILATVPIRSTLPDPASPTIPAISPSSSPKPFQTRSSLISSEAREELTRVMNGEHPPPSRSENPEAFHRYVSMTNRWINGLSAEDCESLLDAMERGRLSHELGDKLHSKYGELLGKQAIVRKGTVPRAEQDWNSEEGRMVLSDKGYKTCNMVAGWAKREPENAWNYYRSWDLPDGRNPLRDAHLGYYHIVLSWIFHYWAARDPDAAFARVMDSPQEELEWASGAYYRGVKGPDFASEAARLDRLLALRPELLEHEWSTASHGAKYMLSVYLATVWVDRDPVAAFEWWSTRIHPESDAEQRATQRVYSNALLFERWSDPNLWEDPSPPKRAAQWLEDNPQMLSELTFRNQALPAIARTSPDTAIRLIRGLGDPQQQAYYLSQLTRDSDSNRLPLLDPAAVESELPHFDFNSDQLNLVMNAIAERRKYESEKPIPADCGW